MRILAIETSCDETAAAVVEDTTILSSVKFTQTSHAEFGGVVPSLAKRDHEARIDEIVNSAMLKAQCSMLNIDAIAVTVGPGLAIALEVGIKKAKELANRHNKPLIAVNHIEGHLLSPLATLDTSPYPSPIIGEGIKGRGINFPAMGLVVSGGHTELILIEEIGKYKIIAETIDDALGEALDKAARILGFPYPGGALLEKAAALGNPKKYLLPLPMAGKEDQNQFSYSGLKSAFGRLISAQKKVLSTQEINDLAAAFQNRAFEHLTRVVTKSITPLPPLNLRGGGESNEPRVILVGGGVIANQELRRHLNKLGEELNLKVYFAPTELTGDNAAMIGIAASFKAEKKQFVKDFDNIDRLPRWRIDQGITPPFRHPS
ncbi:MAG: putative tRNA threonylcarbamoyladenosine biosynthesis protein Gcp [Candidatus Amesbacteria bacterium GW2011_GWA2_42_12]|uniref:tRNA N6-adenosine threonylcarbamoyltransferase n=1 Tax=Candidatus Amesbacteria bacterium GW2011_GWA2_42_12 TaxID=1618356 RepID=A0A0G1AGG9_9BACT|nr:MAG: putative tRNA threonylcarbamoyladenosine biosynthesis protein Gcp [Candidatus Amesbacteria bacterium GW2011_GWA2_42_12]